MERRGAPFGMLSTYRERRGIVELSLGDAGYFCIPN